MANFKLTRDITYDTLSPNGAATISVPIIEDIAQTTIQTRGSFVFESSTNKLYVSDGVSWNSIATGEIPTLIKGGLITSDGTGNTSLSVGADGLFLSADSGESTGLKWAAPPAVPTLTKGGIISSDGATNGTLAAGASTQILSVNPAEALGLEWIPNPVPTLGKGDILTSDGASNSTLTVGADTRILTADSSAPTGLKWEVNANLPPLTPGELVSSDGIGPAALSAGVNGTFLTADNTELLGMKWTTVATSLSGSGQTTGAVTADIINIPLSADGSCFVSVIITGYDSAGNDSVGHSLKGLFKTVASVATQIGFTDSLAFEGAPLAGTSADFVTSGVNVIIRVTGIVGVTVDWSCVATTTCV